MSRTRFDWTQTPISLHALLLEHVDQTLIISWRYNGGWTKKIEGIDKTQPYGFSLVGPFVQGDLQITKPGLYIDCNIQGSRTKPIKVYTLFEFKETGKIRVIKCIKERRDWAQFLWRRIERWFVQKEDKERKKLDKECKKLEEQNKIEQSAQENSNE